MGIFQAIVCLKVRNINHNDLYTLIIEDAIAHKLRSACGTRIPLSSVKL